MSQRALKGRHEYKVLSKRANLLLLLIHPSSSAASQKSHDRHILNMASTTSNIISNIFHLIVACGWKFLVVLNSLAKSWPPPPSTTQWSKNQAFSSPIWGFLPWFVVYWLDMAKGGDLMSLSILDMLGMTVHNSGIIGIVCLRRINGRKSKQFDLIERNVK